MIFDPRAQSTDATEPLDTQLRRAVRPLASPEDLDPLLDAVGDARFVLLGEATHGTSDFYTWRGEESKRLLLEEGFSFIAGAGGLPERNPANRCAQRMAD